MDEIADFCARLRRLRAESGNPTLAWLSNHPLCPAKSQLSKILRGQIRRLPDADIVRGIVSQCARWAGDHGWTPVLPTDERHWLIERDVVERRMADRARPTAEVATPQGGAVRFALPRDLATFTGREDQLAELVASVDEVVADPDQMFEIQLIDGMPGVGKTVFAVHIAHRLADRFPDGQFFVNLHGHTRGREPVDPSDALETLLLVTGVDPRRMPRTLEERAALWRDRMARRTALLLLDNAKSYEQIAPLLPASRRCLVVVTSRRRLALVPDARSATLDVLPPAEAEELFLRLSRATDRDPAAVADLMRLCGCLPLAISLLAGRLRHHPSWPLRHLVERVSAALTSTRNRLGEIRAQDVAVAAAFELSYQDLPASEQRLFRRLSLHPGPDLDAYAAAALDGTGVTGMAERLERLHDDHLLTEYRPGRYRFHDLIRLYAAELADAQDAVDNATAVLRLLEYYVPATAAATGQLPEYLEHRGTTGPEPAVDLPSFEDRTAALAWLDGEHDSLVAAVTVGASSRLGLDLSVAVHPYLRLRGHFSQAEELYRTALGVADPPRDVAAMVLIQLAVAQRLACDYPAARETALRAQLTFADLGDQLGEATAYFELIVLCTLVGDYSTGRAAADDAYRKFTAIDHRLGLANTLLQSGVMERCMENHAHARDLLDRAYLLFVELGSLPGQAATLKDSGILLMYLDELRLAAESLRESQRLCVQLGDPFGQANALMPLGWTLRLAGDHSGARAALASAYQLYVDTGDRLGQANTLNELSLLQRLVGEYDEALRSSARAHQLYIDIDVPFGRADSLHRQGAAEAGIGNHERARDILAESHRRFAKIGDVLGQGDTLSDLGAVLLAMGELDTAAGTLADARQRFRTAGSRRGEVEVRNRLGELALRAGQVSDALEHHEWALANAERIESLIEQARAHEGIAHCRLAEGDRAQARHHAELAGGLYARMQVPVSVTLRQAMSSAIP